MPPQGLLAPFLSQRRFIVIFTSQSKAHQYLWNEPVTFCTHKKYYLKITLFQSFPIFQIDYTQWDEIVQTDRADN